MAEYEGDGSYRRLIANIYGSSKENNFDIKYKEYIFDTNIDLIVFQNQLLFVLSGIYNYTDGTPMNQTRVGYYWEQKPINNLYARELYFYSNAINPRHNNIKGTGYSLRCVAKFYFSLDFYAYL